MQVISLCVSVVSAILLHSSYTTAIAYERPVHSASICLLSCALCLYIAGRYHPHRFGAKSTPDQSYELLASDSHASQTEHKEGAGNDHSASDDVRSLPKLGLAAVLLAIRIEVFRKVRHNEACAGPSFEAFVPVVLSIYNWQAQNRFEAVDNDSVDSSLYDDLFSMIWNSVLRPRWRFTTPIFLISSGCYALNSLWRGYTSNIVCTIATGDAIWVPRLQLFGMMLDCTLAIAIDSIASAHKLKKLPSQHVLLSCVSVLMGAVLVWIGIALLTLYQNVDNGFWMILLDTHQRGDIFLSAIGQALFCCVFLLSTINSVMTYGILPISILLTMALNVAFGIKLLWSARRPYPPVGFGSSFWSFLLAFFGLWICIRILRDTSTSETNRYSRSFTLPIVVLLIALWPVYLKSSSVHFHPIDLLMYDARIEHDEYYRLASYSKTLHDAVLLYKSRYRDNPPPLFDVWWAFARERNVTITDDYDQVFVDLQRFRVFAPAELRRQTSVLLADPSNDIGGISIRSGKAVVHKQNQAVADRMLEGVASMIHSFARHLPDMDLAFNLKDQPRITPPYGKITDQVEQMRFVGSQQWSKERGAQWSQPGENESKYFGLDDWALQNSFATTAASGCPRSSAARRMYLNQFQPSTCLHCAAPHSMGQFLANWSLAADPCHQPDLAQLYGPYLSPTTFTTFNQLLPVFSQSKMHGFGDILYPSAWNHMGSIKYNPDIPNNNSFETQAGYPDLPFQQKVNALYWRGGNTEGTSSGNRVWRGMARQRLVHMTNNLTTSFHDHVTVLLPDPSNQEKYSYQSFPAAVFVKLGLQTDTHLEDNIGQCAGRDCSEQEEELGTVPRSDFQHHWKYRFLIDMDGAGTTGHFIPFLQSHSVPFKTGMHREWYDSRLTPWRHFVPQDIRLHGLWSTLAYFAGVDSGTTSSIAADPHGSSSSTSGGIKWDSHLREAELIAEEGRNWANKVLRREDMEVYMFRLLLEWARLTDDRRDDLGFTVSDEPTTNMTVDGR